MKNRTKLPYFLDSERTPLVEQLLEILRDDRAYIQELEQEINRLKKLPSKPRIVSNKTSVKEKSCPIGKRPGSSKEQKTKNLPIHETHIIKLDDKPSDASFKGYRPYTVQEIVIKAVNHLFQCERWQLSDGTYIQALLPAAYRNHHFGPTLRAYVLHQHYHQGVTQCLLQKQLQEWGIKISKGQLNNLLIENKESYHEEKKSILKTGLFVSSYLQADDTGARHQGKNGFCTYIGNEFFAYFESTGSKSRLNFLSCLMGDIKGYHLDEIALLYLKKQKSFPRKVIALLSGLKIRSRYFPHKEELISWIEKYGIKTPNEIKLCIEAGLYSQFYRFWLKREMFLLTDEAGQFRLPYIKHALCWLHIERKIKELVPFTDEQRLKIEEKRNAFWDLYHQLSKYKKHPTLENKILIRKQFINFCEPVDNYVLLSDVLSRIRRWEEKLLLVLDYPFIPLHNNTSERDIREFVRRRKISGGTRNDEGRRCRDTFASLKKTCQKVQIRFWDYLIDRNYKDEKIKPIVNYIHTRVIEKKYNRRSATSTY